MAKNQKAKELMREAKTRVWRDHLRGIEGRRDVVGAWSGEDSDRQ